MNMDPPSKEATQSIRLDEAVAVAGRAPSRTANRRPSTKNKRRKFRLSRRDRITLITLASITVLLVIAAIIALSSMFAAPEDDGLILKGVVAAGVNLGGMTPEEAAAALEEATANTYTKLDMIVTVLDSQIKLSPANTGANLDIPSVVQDAYNYGRTGSRTERERAKNAALANSVIIPITPHLNLNTEYIKSEISKLGGQFTSTLTQPTITLTGTKPDMGVSKPDTEKVHQTLTIYVGTAEYGLDMNKLYEQVLEYYNINIFQVVGTCTVIAPDSIEEQLLTYYQDLCVEPVDAQINQTTYEVTPEVYGYGFNLDEVKDQISSAAYGTTLEIPLRYLAPNITEELISGNLFKNELGSFTSSLGLDDAWNQNVNLACQKLNGLILKSGDEFSFNTLLGELKAEDGYQNAIAYVGRTPIPVLGGGVSHVASVLYNAILEAELQVLEHHNHIYAVSFIQIGRDAYICNGQADFRFKNSRPDPIRIDAKVVDNSIQISIVGADNRDYRVEIETVIVKVKYPDTLSNIMQPNNPGGYADGDELVLGMNGYDVEVYRKIYTKQSTIPSNEVLLSIARYEAKDSVVVSLSKPSVPPTKPTEPSNPSEPSTPGTESSEPSNPSEPSTPGTESSEPSGSTNSTESSAGNQDD